VETALRKHLSGGAFTRVTAQRSEAMRAVKGKGNRTTERSLRLGLVRAGIGGWTMHPADISGKPDFFFPDARLAVFVDGCFWHGCPRCGHFPKTNRSFWRAKIERNRERDVAHSRCLRRQGLRVLRLWEHDVQNDIVHCIDRISAAACPKRGRVNEATAK